MNATTMNHVATPKQLTFLGFASNQKSGTFFFTKEHARDMQSTLSAHLNHLQEKIQELNDKLTLPASELERQIIQRRLELAAESLKHYQRAYELEQAIDQTPPVVLVHWATSIFTRQDTEPRAREKAVGLDTGTPRSAHQP